MTRLVCRFSHRHHIVDISSMEIGMRTKDIEKFRHGMLISSEKAGSVRMARVENVNPDYVRLGVYDGHVSDCLPVMDLQISESGEPVCSDFKEVVSLTQDEVHKYGIQPYELDGIQVSPDDQPLLDDAFSPNGPFRAKISFEIKADSPTARHLEGRLKGMSLADIESESRHGDFRFLPCREISVSAIQDDPGVPRFTAIEDLRDSAMSSFFRAMAVQTEDHHTFELTEVADRDVDTLPSVCWQQSAQADGVEP